MTKSEMARRIIEEFPRLSKAELGRKLASRYPESFNSVDDGRYFIRKVTGKAGSMRAKLTDKYIGPKLNQGRANDYKHYILDAKRIAILSDIHIPFHNREALYLALTWVKQFEPDCILLNGDIIDCYQLSNFQKDPDERSFADELKELHNFLDDLKSQFDCKVIYKMGNHEERFERFMIDKGKDIRKVEDIDGKEILSWESITHAKKYGHEIVTNKRIIKAGKLNIVHGHEFGKSIFSPVNPARGFYLRAKCSVIGGHYHQTSEHIEKDLNDSVSGAWSTGALCDMHPAYMPLNRWNLGFACVEIEDNNFTVHNKKIMNGKIV